MLGEEDGSQLAGSELLPPGSKDNRKIYTRSVSWAGKARTCLPPLQPLSVSRPKAEEWPRAGSDDLGVWPNVSATTPGVKARPPALPLNSNKNLGKPPREFEFKKDKLAFFDKECSRIIDHVYLGSDAVAKNRNVLRENGITHVLNCVGFVCPEYFKNDLVYKTLWLQDSPSEDITSILYDVFDYFEDVREQNGRVFVHCCQGVSRSTSLVIAYLMWRQGQSFETAFQQVKATRGVTNPNLGFASQLLQCQKRVHAVPVSPSSILRMYRIAPHSSYAPLHLVPKLLARPNESALDSRGAFIVSVPSAIYAWIGKSCDPLMYESARLAASQVIRYEKANGPALIIKEGDEPIEFWNAIVNDQNQDQDRVNGYRGIVGQRRVVDYDIDFGVFSEAANSGVVPPFSISGNDSELCLPARRSGWERLRRKFATGVMKELMTSAKVEPGSGSGPEPGDSPNSCSSFSAVSDSKFDESECMSPKSFGSFLVDDPTSTSISPSTSDYSNSFSFSPSSSNWSDSSVLEASDHSLNLNPNTKSVEISPSKNLIRTCSFSMEDVEEETTVEDDGQNGQQSMYEAEIRLVYNDQNDPGDGSFVLYQWPTMERVETGGSGIPDSRCVYITYGADILYIWVGRDFLGIDGDDNIKWQTVGNKFLLSKGLKTSSIVQIVREGEEPEQLWMHLHCFSFQNTQEKDQNG
ncbi:protein-tyrosine-phosphatase MKP1-like [Rutidosis leptorrhynchoides]|uniref:protein-tyrosine-phosphatase MKP1-like n=1 Tax=Rutidosis leptorrhynchoides TaxID=125765 RepID=UPI003A9A3F6D